MSMIGTDIATIPTSGFPWYVLFLEDSFDEPIAQELRSNFLALGKELGPAGLVIRGFDPNTFYTSAYETLTLYDDQWHKRLSRPALLISDTAPRLLLNEKDHLAKAKIVFIPLAPFRSKASGSVAALLRDLVAALRSPEALEALTRLEPGALQKSWGWISKYGDFKPGFFGFSVDLNALVADLLTRSQP